MLKNRYLQKFPYLQKLSLSSIKSTTSSSTSSSTGSSRSSSSSSSSSGSSSSSTSTSSSRKSGFGWHWQRWRVLGGWWKWMAGKWICQTCSVWLCHSPLWSRFQSGEGMSILLELVEAMKWNFLSLKGIRALVPKMSHEQTSHANCLCRALVWRTLLWLSPWPLLSVVWLRLGASWWPSKENELKNHVTLQVNFSAIPSRGGGLWELAWLPVRLVKHGRHVNCHCRALVRRALLAAA